MVKKKASRRGDEVPEDDLPGAVYKIDQVVLAYHGPCIYQAKVLKQKLHKKKENTIQYFVHYNKWNKKWDEWVGEDRLMEDNEQNRIKMDSANKKTKARPERKVGDKAKGDQKDKVGGKKAKKDPTIEPEDERAARGELKLKLPGQLKKYLVTDWENITRNQTLCPLPRDVTVSQILDKWTKTKKDKSDQQAQAVEVAAGLKRFFHGSISVLLLYRFERPQFEDLLEERKIDKDNLDDMSTLCDIYGAEHLARLFVKLPDILNYTSFEAKELAVLQSKLSDFLKWFARSKEFFAVDKYKSTDTEYAGRVGDVPM